MLARAQIPNQLTLLRLVLAALFFLALNQYRYDPPQWTWILWAAIGLFILAGLTDMLDGYLARRWKVESTFGRIMDPFCDKVIILGAFIYLAGPRFVLLEAPAGSSRVIFNMVSGIYPWMVVVMLARELLVTGIRGQIEGQGVKFGANIWGKLKAILQFVVVPILLWMIWMDPIRNDGWHWLIIVRDVLVYATVVVTVISGVPYITAAARTLQAPPKSPTG
ncbi:MAG: CDP-alcohol phosphatidyltransferase family protein [Phycisphaeraceae bacterium]|nr:CDP-alcohol phosphatidyltransferase family protein [Phycisphaeraceae bacterium]